MSVKNNSEIEVSFFKLFFNRQDAVNSLNIKVNQLIKDLFLNKLGYDTPSSDVNILNKKIEPLVGERSSFIGQVINSIFFAIFPSIKLKIRQSINNEISNVCKDQSFVSEIIKKKLETFYEFPKFRKKIVNNPEINIKILDLFRQKHENIKDILFSDLADLLMQGPDFMILKLFDSAVFKENLDEIYWFLRYKYSKLRDNSDFMLKLFDLDAFKQDLYMIPSILCGDRDSDDSQLINDEDFMLKLLDLDLCKKNPGKIGRVLGSSELINNEDFMLKVFALDMFKGCSASKIFQVLNKRKLIDNSDFMLKLLALDVFKEYVDSIDFVIGIVVLLGENRKLIDNSEFMLKMFALDLFKEHANSIKDILNYSKLIDNSDFMLKMFALEAFKEYSNSIKDILRHSKLKNNEDFMLKMFALDVFKEHSNNIKGILKYSELIDNSEFMLKLFDLDVFKEHANSIDDFDAWFEDTCFENLFNFNKNQAKFNINEEVKDAETLQNELRAALRNKDLNRVKFLTKEWIKHNLFITVETMELYTKIQDNDTQNDKQMRKYLIQAMYNQVQNQIRQSRDEMKPVDVNGKIFHQDPENKLMEKIISGDSLKELFTFSLAVRNKKISSNYFSQKAGIKDGYRMFCLIAHQDKNRSDLVDEKCKNIINDIWFCGSLAYNYLLLDV